MSEDLWKIIKRFNPRKIMQIGLESKGAIQMLIEMGQYLQKQKDRDAALIYALARDPVSYLAAIQAIKRSRLAGIVQPYFGLSLPREAVPGLSPRDRSALCGNLKSKNEKSGVEEAAKYLPDRFIAGFLEDLKFNVDLFAICSNDRPVIAELEAIRNHAIAPACLLIQGIPHAADIRRMERLFKPLGIWDGTISQNVKGMLIAYRAARNKEEAVIKAEAADRQAQPKNIAIVLVEHFGDIVACEPVARYVRSAYPNAHITWVTKEIYREIVEDNPHVDEVLTVGCITEWNLLSKSRIYDKVIDLHIDNRECPICSLPIRKWRERRDVSLDSYYNFGPLLTVFSTYAGLPPLRDAPRIHIPQRVRDRVDELALPEEFIVFHCLSNEYSRDWADEKWLQIARQLGSAWGGKIVEVGTKSCLAEHALPNVVDLCGRVSILESAEIIRRARVFVGVDSGPAHLGNAVGTYGIVLLGDYKAFKHYVPFTGDYASEKNGRLLYSKSGPARRISVQSLLTEIRQALKKAPKRLAAVAKAEDTPAGRWQQESSGERTDPVRLIAFHLPQFHPIPENDRWWGKGFTDWRNVMQGKPLFAGHYQPHLPGELGLYDLRLHDVICRQAEMAKQAQIEGFCFWHYWFNGKLLLEQPLIKLLESGQPDFPFCLAWANENWTRRWDGQESAILMLQNYSGRKDDREHFEWLARFFRDDRYIRIQGRPLFLIYRPFHMKNAKATLLEWRKFARKEGIPDPYFMAIRTNLDSRANLSAIGLGFDDELSFQPNSPDSFSEILNLTNEMYHLFPSLFTEEIQLRNKIGTTVCEYDQAWPIMASSAFVQRASSTCVVPSWDNSPRRVNQGAFILNHATPPSYQRWLQCEIARCREEPQKRRILFVNAWNEWAEGNHLEPDLRYGDGFLEATRRAQQRVGRNGQGCLENIERAKMIARMQTIARRVVKAIHQGLSISEDFLETDREGNLFARITDVLAASNQVEKTEEKRRKTLIAVVQEFIKAYPATPLLVQMYNQASALESNEKKREAKSLFELLAEVTDKVLPELCGKSHYKLALMEKDKKETIHHLAYCVSVYPEHRAAAELLNKLKKAEKGKKNRKMV